MRIADWRIRISHILDTMRDFFMLLRTPFQKRINPDFREDAVNGKNRCTRV